jgi:hypothetical protein
MAAERQPHSQARREDSPVAILTRHSSVTGAPLIARPPRAQCARPAVRVESDRWREERMSMVWCWPSRGPRPSYPTRARRRSGPTAGSAAANAREGAPAPAPTRSRMRRADLIVGQSRVERDVQCAEVERAPAASARRRSLARSPPAHPPRSTCAPVRGCGRKQRQRARTPRGARVMAHSASATCAAGTGSLNASSAAWSKAGNLARAG